jgi:hypothetical protein
MKITDLIVEQQLDEKPMGALSGIGNKIASKFGSGKAMGKLDTGKIANDLRKQFDIYLGKTGEPAEPQAIIDFLSSMGLPTDAVNASSAAATTTAPAKDMKSTLGIGKNAGQPMATPNQPKRVDPTLDPSAPIAAPNQPSRVDPTLDPAAGDTTNYDIPTFQRKGMAPPVTQPMDKNKFNQSALKARLKAGSGAGKVKTGFGGYKAAAAAKGLKAGMYDSVSYDDLKQELFLTEALSGGQIDKIFLATAQLMAKQGFTGGTNAAAPSGSGAGAAPSGASNTAAPGPGSNPQSLAKSFLQGYKDTPGGQKGQSSAFNKTQDPNQDFAGNLNFNQLAKLLPNTDQQTLIRALRLVIGGGKLNQQQLGVLGVAMTDIVKADAQTTTKIMQTLKRISAE